MEANKRACFALIAASLVNKKQYNSVHDYQQGRTITISSMNSGSFYDHNRGGNISGNDNSMFDHVTGTHVSINLNDNTVNCFDFESNNHINYTVNGSSVSAYDFQTSSHYSYSVS